MLNLNNVESFYHIARFGGLTQASRHVHYGITQPTLSRQLRELEEESGTMLCHRRPFRLTPAGEMLFAFIKPFFEGLGEFPKLFQAAHPIQIRIGGPPVVLRDSLPPLLLPLAKAFPNLSFELKAGMQEQIDEWFRKEEIDLAVTVLEGQPPASCHTRPLLNLPMALLVPRNSSLRSAEALCRQRRIKERLITPPTGDAITKYFELGLRQQAIDWPSRFAVNTIELLEAYVAKGFGLGLTLLVPGCNYVPEVRVLPLYNFPLVPGGLIWRRDPQPVTLALMSAMEHEAQRMREQPGHQTQPGQGAGDHTLSA